MLLQWGQGVPDIWPPTGGRADTAGWGGGFCTAVSSPLTGSSSCMVASGLKPWCNFCRWWGSAPVINGAELCIVVELLVCLAASSFVVTGGAGTPIFASAVGIFLLILFLIASLFLLSSKRVSFRLATTLVSSIFSVASVVGLGEVEEGGVP